MKEQNLLTKEIAMKKTKRPVSKSEASPKKKKTSTKAVPVLGSSVSIDMAGCDETFLKEVEILKSICRTAVELVHGTEQKCFAFYRRYSSDIPIGGTTIFVGMKEGSIVMVTDSVKKFLTIDIIAIDTNLKMQPAVGYFTKQIKHTQREVVYSDRLAIKEKA